MADIEELREIIILVFQTFLVIFVVLLVVMAFSINPQLLIDNFSLLFGILLGFIGGAGAALGLKKQAKNNG